MTRPPYSALDHLLEELREEIHDQDERCPVTLSPSPEERQALVRVAARCLRSVLALDSRREGSP